MSTMRTLDNYYQVKRRTSTFTAEKLSGKPDIKTPNKNVTVASKCKRSLFSKNTVFNNLENDCQSCRPEKHAVPEDNICGSPWKVQKTEEKIEILRPQGSPAKPNQTNNSPSTSKYTPKRSLSLSTKQISQKPNKDQLVITALEQLNLANQGAIPPNNFDLNEIYLRSEFDYQYWPINPKTMERYEYEAVVSYGGDMNCDIFFISIMTVFSNPINCGYFDKDELDLIYFIITLPIPCQTLLIRMLKRQRTWHRKSTIIYPDIEDIFKIFCLLEKKSICTFATNEMHLHDLLDLLHSDEAKELCKHLKINSTGKKEDSVQKLKKFAKTKPILSSNRNQANYLCSLVIKKIGYCVRITDKMWDIFERIITLLIPSIDPKLNLADIFLMLQNIYKQITIFPQMPEKRFPIFSTKQQLLKYISAKSILTRIYKYKEKKDVKNVVKLGHKCKEELNEILPDETEILRNSSLPAHVKCFMPGYILLKALSVTIYAFKSQKTEDAISILEILINQDCHLQHKKGEWYEELALVEMHHMKNIVNSGIAILRGLQLPNINEINKIKFVQRANRIINKKKGMNDEMRNIQSQLQIIIKDTTIEAMELDSFITKVLAQSCGNTVVGRKRTYRIESNAEEQSYGSVENFAISHYHSQGFQGLHCEGGLPVTLFAILFWEEIYTLSVPGAYVTMYQCAPGDLYTDRFYENRAMYIDAKREIIRNWDSKTLGEEVENRFNVYQHYDSLIQTGVFKDGTKLKQIVYCLGVHSVVEICNRLIENFKIWQSGFPDLVLQIGPCCRSTPYKR